ncbi:MAG: protein translocase subunit SecF [bacterium]|nr:protein translocase subunit SecF [bacterium]
MKLVRARKFTYVLSALLILVSIGSLLFYGLELGIDFTGGSILEGEFSAKGGATYGGSGRPEIFQVQEKINSLNFGAILIQPTGEKGILVKTRSLSEEEHQQVLKALSILGEFKEFRFDSIGPTIGKELRTRSVYATILVLVAIILYIAFAFRKVSRPVSSWFYGLAAVVALFHDIFIPIGLFSALGHFKGVEIDTLFVTAILTVLGFSVHDTIVVFDRIRENLKKPGVLAESFEETVGKSLSQTLARSINTSLTVLIVLVALYFLGSPSTKYFSLALIIGIIAGTYSSIFIASPLLVTWNNWRSKK